MVMESALKHLKEKVIPLTPSPIYTYLFKMVSGIYIEAIAYIEKREAIGATSIANPT